MVRNSASENPQRGVDGVRDSARENLRVWVSLKNFVEFGDNEPRPDERQKTKSYLMNT